MTDLEIVRATVLAAVQIERSGDRETAIAEALKVSREVGADMINVVKGPDANVLASGQVLQCTCHCGRNYFTDGPGRYDPFVLRGLRATQPLSAEEIKESRLTQRERDALDYLETTAGYTAGLIVPVRKSVHPNGVVVFAGPATHFSAPVRAALTLLGHCLYARVNELADDEARQIDAGVALSDREAEVLSWVAKGKRDSEIAIICDIAERTARFHVANAKLKLGAMSRIQAVTKALELGLITA